MGPMGEPAMMSSGSHMHGVSQMGNGQMGNGQQYRVHQMRTSDPSGFVAQQRMQEYLPQHAPDASMQPQQRGNFGTAPSANTNAASGRPGGRTQRAAAQAARGRSFAAAADPFTYMDD